MTVLTMPAQSVQDTAAPRPVPWRLMIWVTWRQHRAMLISVLAVLGAIAVFLWIAGLDIHHNYAVMTACHPAGSSACQTLSSNFTNTDWTMANTLDILLQLAPVLIGAFAGAPLLARELEAGTYRYSWTQGFGRARWAIAKLVLVAVTVTVAAWAFSEVFTWFFKPFLAQESLTELSATAFANRGIAFAAWTLVAFSIGAFLGMLFRRTIPAMAVTLGVYLGLALGTWWLRPHYPVALVTSNPSIGGGAFSPSSPTILSVWYTGAGGKPANPALVNKILAQFKNGHAPPRHPLTFAQYGITQWTKYLPVSRFWPMQFIEAGWLLVLSALLIAGTVWLVRRRAA